MPFITRTAKLVPGRSTLKTALGHTLWPMLTRFTAGRAISRNSGLIYTFHYIGTPVIPGACEDLFLPVRTFAAVLDFVCRHLTPLAPAEFLQRLENGTLPARATMLTFDDCTRDAYTRALPELAKRNLKACFFACPGLIDQRRTIPILELMDICNRAPRGVYDVTFEERSWRSSRNISFPVSIDDTSSRRRAYYQLAPHLYNTSSTRHAGLLASLRFQLRVDDSLPHTYPLATWEDLNELHRAGMWIASHTMSHSTPHADSPEELAADYKRAFEIMDSRFGAPRRIFCYPYGSAADVSEETAGILAVLKTNTAFVTRGGLARPHRDGMLNLRREDAAYSVGGTKLSPLLAIYR
ncbi:MAG: polysaccharide deacetylase family protein [Bryobacteraceae bacterium]|nr:polysaccharide deacetylase family protein [Bryobacteraceae bacterium]